MGWVKGWLHFFCQNRWQKYSGFEYENLCRKCLLSVEHFVSSRKTTTKKAKCGVFVFISRNIYQFSEQGGTGYFLSLFQILVTGLAGATFHPACAQGLRSQPRCSLVKATSMCLWVKVLKVWWHLAKLSFDRHLPLLGLGDFNTSSGVCL